MNQIQGLELLWLSLASNQRYVELIDQADKAIFSQFVSNEGLSFLTQGLPSIGKAIDRYYSTKEWHTPLGFETQEVLTTWSDNAQIMIYDLINIPVFMGKAIQQALAGNPTAVDCVRQLSYIFYKLEVPYESGVVDKVLDQFISTDHELSLLDLDHISFNNDDLIKSMRVLIHRILVNEDPTDITPSHSSGATACRTPNYDKYHKLNYYKKLDDVYHYSDYFFVNYDHLIDDFDRLEKSPHMEPMARVCLVPKDSRGPRIISCEPAELMYIQQGIMRKLYEILETHHLSSGQLNFIDQTVNRNLARQASIDNKLATIDLSEASDRVSLDLVRRIFPQNWVEALEASRSECTLLPDGRVMKLNKFAPMGSSCCFPVEALVFWACAKAVLRIKHKIGNCAIYVYGDDIIMPSLYADDIMSGLELIGLKVNKDKSYLDGPFRESCGGDFFLGENVTPVRLRKTLNSSLAHVETTADFCNNLIAKFGYEDSLHTISIVEMIYGYSFPRTPLALPGTIRAPLSASNDVFFRRRWNKDLQRFEHQIPRTACKVKQRRAPGWCELLRKLLSMGSLNSKSSAYENPVSIRDSQLKPGWYTDPHSVKTVWKWTWLG